MIFEEKDLIRIFIKNEFENHIYVNVKNLAKRILKDIETSLDIYQVTGLIKSYTKKPSIMVKYSNTIKKHIKELNEKEVSRVYENRNEMSPVV